MNEWAKDQMVIDAMSDLEKIKYVARLDDGSELHKHRAEWAINPAIVTSFADHRKRVLRAKQRQRDEIYKLSTRGRRLVKGYDPELMDEE
jgi:hypothetical protein